LPFYASIRTRDVLLIDRDPWQIEQYVNRNGTMTLAGRSTPDEPGALTSTTLPFSFRLVAAIDRPLIELVYLPSGQTWQV